MFRPAVELVVSQLVQLQLEHFFYVNCAAHRLTAKCAVILFNIQFLEVCDGGPDYILAGRGKLEVGGGDHGHSLLVIYLLLILQHLIALFIVNVINVQGKWFNILIVLAVSVFVHFVRNVLLHHERILVRIYGGDVLGEVFHPVFHLFLIKCTCLVLLIKFIHFQVNGRVPVILDLRSLLVYLLLELELTLGQLNVEGIIFFTVVGTAVAEELVTRSDP